MEKKNHFCTCQNQIWLSKEDNCEICNGLIAFNELELQASQISEQLIEEMAAFIDREMGEGICG